MIVYRRNCLRCHESIRHEDIDLDKKLYKCRSCQIVASVVTESSISKKIKVKLPENWEIVDTGNEVRLKMPKTYLTERIQRILIIVFVIGFFLPIIIFFGFFALFSFTSFDLPIFIFNGWMMLFYYVVFILGLGVWSKIMMDTPSEIIVDLFSVRVRGKLGISYEMFHTESYMIDQVYVKGGNIYIYDKQSEEITLFLKDQATNISEFIFIEQFLEDALGISDRYKQAWQDGD